MQVRKNNSFQLVIAICLSLLFFIMLACGGGGGGGEGLGPFTDPFNPNTSTAPTSQEAADEYTMLGSTLCCEVSTSGLPGTGFTFAISEVQKTASAAPKEAPSEALFYGATIDPNTGVITWTPTETGYFVFVIQITNNLHATFTKNLSVSVIDPRTNNAPVIAEILPQTASVGTAFSLQVSATDDNGTVTFATSGDAPEGLSISTTGLISWTPTVSQSSATHYVVIKASDIYGAFSYKTMLITVGNSDPEIPDIVAQTATAGTEFLYKVSVNDNNPPYTFSLISPPSGMTIDTTGTIHWTPTASEHAGLTFTINVQVTDAAGGLSTNSFTTLVENAAPVISDIPTLVATPNVAFSYALPAADPNPMTYALSNSPAGMTVDVNGNLLWTPTLLQEGFVYPRIGLTVSDPYGLSSYKEFDAVATLTNKQLDPLTTYDFQLSVQSGTAPYSWSLQGEPVGLTIDATGKISWTPPFFNQGVEYTFTVSVQDSHATAPMDTSFPVTLTAKNLAPVIASIPDQTACQNALFRLDITPYINEPNTPLTYSLIAVPSIAPAMTIGSSGVIEWTPTASGGPEIVTVRVADSKGLSSTKSFLMSVFSDIAVTTATLTPATVNGFYVSRLAGVGGTLPYTWSLQAGALPSGIELDTNTGFLYGYPTSAGAFAFTIRMTSGALTRDKNFSISVSDLGIITEKIPEATVGLDYAANLVSAGGTPPYTWEINGGNLPAGLVFSSGTIAGKPTESGTFQIEIKITDSLSATATKSFYITSNPDGAMTFNYFGTTKSVESLDEAMALYFASDTSGQDITISETKNIHTDVITTGRTYPDGVSFAVESIGQSSVDTVLTPNGISNGDKVLLINLGGDTSNHENAGNCEVFQVQSIGTKTIIFTSKITKEYGVGGNSDLTGQKIIIQRIPCYKNLTINIGATLTCSAWDGQTGGVMIFKVKETLKLDGEIDVSAKGFRGGRWSGTNPPENASGDVYTGGANGEDGLTNRGGNGGSGTGQSAGTGGNGANGHNATKGTGSRGGGGGCDCSCWGIRGAGGGGAPYNAGNNISDGTTLVMGGGAAAGGGGGGGSYFPGSGGPFNIGYGGSQNGAGGTGGTAAANGQNGAAGGCGGGLIIIDASSLSGAGTVKANGGNGGSGGNGGGGQPAMSNGGGGGAGGNGGAGGTIYIISSNGTPTIQASGGTGGNGGNGSTGNSGSTAGGTGGTLASPNGNNATCCGGCYGWGGGGGAAGKTGTSGYTAIVSAPIAVVGENVAGAITTSTKISPTSNGTVLGKVFSIGNDYFIRRCQVAVSGSAVDLTNYQVKISVTYDADMQADFDDIRFVDSDNSTKLQYWTEKYTASTSAVFWVKIPSLPSAGKTIYMYYGNPNLSSISSGSKVFDFFEDFSGNLDNWSVRGSMSIIDEELYSPSNTASDSTPTYSLIYSGLKYVVEYDIKWISGTRLQPVPAYVNDSNFARFWSNDAATTNYQERVAATWSGSVNVGANNAVDGQWYKWSIVKTDTQATLFINDVQIGAPQALNAAFNTDTKIGLSAYNSECRWDNVRVRKYASPVPAAVVGAEETGLQNYSSETIYTCTIQPEALSSWGQITFNDLKASNGGPANTTVKYQLEYWDGNSWELVPDGDLTGNSAGFSSSPVNISAIDAGRFIKVRIVINAATVDPSVSPRLYDVKITWTP